MSKKKYNKKRKENEASKKRIYAPRAALSRISAMALLESCPTHFWLQAIVA